MKNTATKSNESSPAVSPKPRTRQVSSRFLSKSLNGPPESGGSASSSPGRRSSVSLADQIGRDRFRDREVQKPKSKTPPPTSSSVLRKQRSYRESNNSDNNSKENDRPIIGRSGRFNFPAKTSSSVKKPSFGNSGGDSPGRASLEEKNAISSSDDSLMMRKVITQKTLSRNNSPLNSPLNPPLTRQLSFSKSQWALSPGRSGTTPMSVENKGKSLSFSSLKPSNKGIEKILNKGFDFFRSKKSSTAAAASSSEDAHQLRLLHNRLLQWRFVNARAEAANASIQRQAESTLTSAVDSIAKLRCSVMQKRILLQKVKLEKKLTLVLHSQMSLLQTWEGMEKKHMAALDAMKESLYAAACKVPLLEGAKVDIQPMSIAQEQALVEVESMKSTLSSFSHMADETAGLLSELAKVVAQEKFLLQEINDLSQTIRALEVEESSLKCSLIQLQN